MNTLFKLFLVCFFIKSKNSLKLFNDDPPPDYFKRTDLRDCQRRFHYDKSSIVRCCNGVEAVSGEFMHMAAIGWNTSGKVEYKCGGTLITSKFILTAAHCASDRNGNRPVTVRLGDTNLEQNDREHPGQQIKIKLFRKHEHFSARRRYDDIALIELEEEAKFNQVTCPACLWLEQSVPAEKMTAIGFGTTGYGEELSSTLQKVHLSELDENRCLEHVQDLRVIPDGLKKGQFCANGLNQDTSEGDSGGPLQTERITLRGIVIPLIVGITSFGTACSYSSVGVYTRVASYKEWIEQVTGKSFNYSSK